MIIGLSLIAIGVTGLIVIIVLRVRNRIALRRLAEMMDDITKQARAARLDIETAERARSTKEQFAMPGDI